MKKYPLYFRTTIEPAERSFPDDFLFGGGTSAFQIEGAWDVDGKGPSIWDEYAHSHPERILDHQNPDIAANSYKYFEDDIEIVKNLSVIKCYLSRYFLTKYIYRFQQMISR